MTRRAAAGVIAAGALVVLAAALVLSAFAEPLSQGWAAVLGDVQVVQRDLHRRLADAIRAVHEHGAAATWTLMTLSFLYGVFHAVGPGHGKIVIGAYLATHESRLKRGVALSLLSSLMQGLTAVVAVETVVFLFHLQFRDAQAASVHLESASYALVTLVGLGLVFASGRRLWGRLRSDRAAWRDAGGATAHSGCGHAHGPIPSEIDERLSLKSLAAVVISVGIRPCSGAILVLLLAHVVGLHWGGVASVLAMSLGTGLAVSALAVLSVYARRAMLRLSQRLDGATGQASNFLDGVALAGGVAVMLVGASLLHVSVSVPSHPLL